MNTKLNYTFPPSVEILENIAEACIPSLPDELDQICPNLQIVIDDFPSETVQEDLELETDFDLLAYYFEKTKSLNLYRRPILDLWCETGDDLQSLIRQLMITELAQYLEFSPQDIERMTRE